MDWQSAKSEYPITSIDKIEFTVQNLEQAIYQFYHTTQNSQVEAHQWLTEIQVSQQIWVLLWDLLHPEKASEAQYFAATTLHIKLSRDWEQIPVEDYETLKRKILDAILCYASGPKVVFNRLCISLACYILRTVRNFWKDPISDILSLFQNTSAIPPEKAAWVVLEILTVIPEEFQTVNLPQSEKLVVQNKLENSITIVTSLIDSLLRPNDQECTKQSVKCAKAWFQMGVPITSCEPLFSHLIEIALSSWSNESPELCEMTLEALTFVTTHHSSYNYTHCLMNLIQKLMPLEVIAESLQRISSTGEFTEDNQELLSATYSLFITIGETHTRVIMGALLSDNKQERESILKIIKIILNCCNAPGEFPIHETYSSSSFSFWYILEDEVVNETKETCDKLSKDILPIYKTLVEILLRKSTFSEGFNSWTAEDKEKFRCYRQDIADTLLYCLNILHNDLLELLLLKLKQCLTESDIKTHWQPLESVIHAFASIAEDISAPNNLLFSFFEIIKSLPLSDLNTKVATTVLDAIGAYAEWIYVNSNVMGDVLPLIIAGLNHSEAAPSATMALKDLTRDSAPAIRLYAPHILIACQKALSSGMLKVNECARLMYTIGKVLTVLPETTVIEIVTTFIPSYVQKLSELSQRQEISPSLKAEILFHLRLMSALFQGLEPVDKDKTPPIVVLKLLESLLPIFNNIINLWHADIDLIEMLCHTLKFGIITLSDMAVQLVPSMLNLIVNAHKLNLNRSTLDISKQFFLLYGNNSHLRSYLSCVICELINLTTSLYSSEDTSSLSQYSDVVETFFFMLHTLLKKSSSILVENQNVDFDALLMCAIKTLSVQEVPTIRSVSTFLVTFIGMSREKPNMLTAVQNRGQLLVYTVILGIGNISPRNSLEYLSDIILALNKKYCDNLYRWLTIVLAEEKFPTPRATPELKQIFMKFILKERTNKRKLHGIVREFGLFSRGVITDMGTSQPFSSV